MLTLAFLLSLTAVLLSTLLLFYCRRLSARVANMLDSHARAVRKLELLEENLSQSLAKARYEFRKQRNELKFHAEMTFREALALNPDVQQIMNKMHVGGCPDCAVELDQTLGYGAASNAVGVEAFLVALNNLDDPRTTPETSPASSALKLISNE